MKWAYTVAALALALSGIAGAHDGQEDGEVVDVSLYAGGSMTQNTFKDWSRYEDADDGSYISRSMDDSDFGSQVFAGIEFGRYVAFEVAYGNYGEATFLSQSDGSGSFWATGPISETIALKSLDVKVLGKLPLSESVALLGRAGTLRWKSTVVGSGASQMSGSPFTFSRSSGGGDYAYGAGLQFDGFRPVRVVVEYTASNFGNAFDFQQQQPKLRSIVLSLAYVFRLE